MTTPQPAESTGQSDGFIRSVPSEAGVDASLPSVGGDAELVGLVRRGVVTAYEGLYRRHWVAARRMARQVCRCSATAEDVVSEAFARVLEALLAGHGPEVSFRAYLLTAVRHVAYDAARQDRQLEWVDDVVAIVDHGPGPAYGGVESLLEAGWEREQAGRDYAIAARACERLPARWQWVLQRTAVDGQDPAALAAEAQLNPNAVAALAFRARRGLRTAFLQVHLDETTTVDRRCRPVVPHLAALVRGQLSNRYRKRVTAHLAQCAACAAVLADLAEVNYRLPA